MKKIALIVLFINGLAYSQMLSVTPAFPNQNDVVTIIYDATQGNGALTDVNTVYIHTGLITNTSASPTDWKHVQGNWGTADANVLMISLGNNLFSITINIPTFYNYPTGTQVFSLAMVFRNANGSIVGRDTDGSDIYYQVYPENSGLLGKIFAPTTYVIANLNETVNFLAKTNQNANVQFENLNTATVIAQNNNATELTHNFSSSIAGDFWIRFTATNGSETVQDSAYILVVGAPNVANPPQETIMGLNRITADSVVFRLFAPEKNNVFLIGDFNDFTPTSDYQMNLSDDGNTWWIGIGGLNENTRYGYQYLIDGTPFADPLSELIADPWSDGNIPAYVYPNPYPYPTSQTSGFVSLFETNPAPFNWQIENFEKPDQENLIIYELLVRDFVAKHDYLTIIDTLDYLANLGINAIELMPVNEFENNESWGYNPSFHMALDKYYGTPEHFKMFVDACHQRGIAVIIDVVLNHAFGQSPMVRMYWDAANNQPAANSPWFNQTCPHPPFCWGYDYNHEVQATKDYIDRVNLHWLDEYKVDGYRFDFTKGFVNANTNFSQTRIDILKRMADTIWSQHPDAYIILEHFCDNNEETILANYGMMIWGNQTHDYHQAMKGFSSNLNWTMYTSRGWDNPHLVSYIESHDEQRGMYEALNFGVQSNTAHNVRNIHVALKRAQTTAVLALLTPGPKMIWQFGEVGYDIDIDFPCRVCNKPILWNYFFDVNRKQVYDVYAATINLRKSYPTFEEGNVSHSLTAMNKRLIFTHPDMDAVVLCNFAVNSSTPIASFTQTGWWYEYFSGDSLLVENVSMQVPMEPGDYKVFTTVKLAQPEIVSTVSIQDVYADEWEIQVFPNPTKDVLNINMSSGLVPERIMILQTNGSIVKEVSVSTVNTTLDCSDVAPGMYLVYIEQGGRFAVKPFVVE